MFCVKCGTQLSENQKFCHKCGAPLGEIQKNESKQDDFVYDKEKKASGNTYSTDRASQNSSTDKDVSSSKKKTKPKALTIVFTVFLSLVLFITSFGVIGILSIRSMIDEDGIESVLEQIEIVDVMKELDPETESNLNILCEAFNKEFDADIRKSDIISFVNDSTVKDFVADKISDFCEDVLEGNKNAELTVSQREIYDLLRDNSDLLEKEFDVELDKETLKDISGWFFEGSELKIMNTQDLDAETDGALDALSVVLSYVTVAILAVISTAVIGLMMLNSLPQAIVGTGINFTVIGILTGIMALLKSWLPLSAFDNAAGELIGTLFAVNAPLGIACFVLGVALIITAIVLKKKSKI